MKNKLTAFRWQERDFEFIRKQAKKQGIGISELLRRIIKDWRDNVEKS